MEIYLIRHTAPPIEKGICYGQTDISVAECFHNEARKLKLRLPEISDAVYSSPLSRCLKMAKQLNPGKEILIDDRLLEMNFGDWEMKNWDEIDQQELNKWMQDFVNEKVPGGENFVTLNNRVNHFIDELLQSSFERVAIFTHAGVIRCFVARVLEISLNNVFRIAVDYSSVAKIHLNRDKNLNRMENLNTAIY